MIGEKIFSKLCNFFLNNTDPSLEGKTKVNFRNSHGRCKNFSNFEKNFAKKFLDQSFVV